MNQINGSGLSDGFLAVNNRPTTTSKIRYRCLVKLFENNKVIYSTSRTFSKKNSAAAWGKKRVIELEEEVIPKPKADIKIRKMIIDYLNHSDIKIGRLKNIL